MQHEYFEKLREIREHEDTFVLATVISVRGSSSAKPGSKAIISKDGRNLWGWVGGGCAESYIIKESLKTLADRQTRIVTVDLDDELLGVGMPCGGYMDVYLEPVLPAKTLLILGDTPVGRSLSALAAGAGFSVIVQDERPDAKKHPFAARLRDEPFSRIDPPAGSFVVVTSATAAPSAVRDCLCKPTAYVGIANEAGRSLFSGKETVAHDDRLFMPAGFALGEERPEIHALGILAQLIAHDRGASGRALDPHDHPPPTHDQGLDTPDILVVGRGRIAEELARLGAVLKWPVTVNGPELQGDDYPRITRLITDDLDLAMNEVGPTTRVIIASQHKGDHKAALNAVKNKAAYIGLIASKKRSKLVRAFLKDSGLGEDELGQMFAPAGLDIGSVTPGDIALSIICQILQLHAGKSKDH